MKFYFADCFADKKYQGNQLAVFLPDSPVSDREMQQIANETGFSETAFILSGKKGNGGYDVRIFTPDVEVPFAGHPVLGTAYIIRRILEKEASDTVLLNLKAGQIPVHFAGGEIIMSQNEPEFGKIIAKGAAAAALSLDGADIRDDYPVQLISTGLEAAVVPLVSAAAVSKCHVNYDERQKFIDKYCKCNIIVFAPDGKNLRVRVFMDDTGFLEDPATGSANGCLAAYLLRYDFFGSSTISYSVSQGCEMGRPSRLSVSASLKDGRYDIKVGGRACIVAEGTWNR